MEACLDSKMSESEHTRKVGSLVSHYARDTIYTIVEFDKVTIGWHNASLTPHPLWSNPGSYLHSCVPAMLIIAPTFLLVVKLWVLSLGLGWWWQCAVLCHVMSREGRGDPGMWQVLHQTRLSGHRQGAIFWKNNYNLKLDSMRITWGPNTIAELELCYPYFIPLMSEYCPLLRSGNQQNILIGKYESHWERGQGEF